MIFDFAFYIFQLNLLRCVTDWCAKHTNGENDKVTEEFGLKSTKNEIHSLEFCLPIWLLKLHSTIQKLDHGIIGIFFTPAK